MQTIPLQAVPSQSINVTLNGQDCTIRVYTLDTGLFLDLEASGVPIVSAVICEDRTLLVRLAYLGFVGDLAFMDTQGTDDPLYSGLGSRWVLLYLTPSDLVA